MKLIEIEQELYNRKLEAFRLHGGWIIVERGNTDNTKGFFSSLEAVGKWLETH